MVIGTRVHFFASSSALQFPEIMLRPDTQRSASLRVVEFWFNNTAVDSSENFSTKALASINTWKSGWLLMLLNIPPSVLFGESPPGIMISAPTGTLAIQCLFLIKPTLIYYLRFSAEKNSPLIAWLLIHCIVNKQKDNRNFTNQQIIHKFPYKKVIVRVYPLHFSSFFVNGNNSQWGSNIVQTCHR